MLEFVEINKQNSNGISCCSTALKRFGDFSEYQHSVGQRGERIMRCLPR
jgi:hypothetical protein